MADLQETFNSPVPVIGIGHDLVWNVYSGQFTMTDGQLTPHVCNFPNKAVLVESTDSEDQILQLEFNELGPPPLAAEHYVFVGLMLRVVNGLPPSREYYSVEWHNRFGSYQIDLIKFTSNVETVLSSTVHDWDAGDVLKATIVGGKLTAFVNGAQVSSYTDASPITGSKKVGVQIDLNCSAGFGNTKLDNLFASSVTVTPPVVVPSSSIPPLPPGSNILLVGSLTTQKWSIAP